MLYLLTVLLGGTIIEIVKSSDLEKLTTLCDNWKKRGYSADLIRIA